MRVSAWVKAVEEEGLMGSTTTPPIHLRALHDGDGTCPQPWSPLSLLLSIRLFRRVVVEI